MAALRERGARHFAVGSWFLAPGLLPDRIIEQGRTQTADPVLAAPMADVADLVLQRYTDALTTASRPAQYSRAQ